MLLLIYISFSHRFHKGASHLKMLESSGFIKNNFSTTCTYYSHFRPPKKRPNLNFRKITIYNLWLMPKHTYIYWQYIIAILFFAGWVCHDNNDNCLLHFTILLILNGDDLAPKMWFSCQVIYVFFKKGTSQPWWEVVRFGGFCGFFRIFSFL